MGVGGRQGKLQRPEGVAVRTAGAGVGTRQGGEKRVGPRQGEREQRQPRALSPGRQEAGGLAHSAEQVGGPWAEPRIQAASRNESASPEFLTRFLTGTHNLKSL